MKLIISLLQNKPVYNGIFLHKWRMLKAIFGEWKQHKFLQQITVLEEIYNLSFLWNMFLNRDYFHACYRTRVIHLEIILFIVLCIKIRVDFMYTLWIQSEFFTRSQSTLFDSSGHKSAFFNIGLKSRQWFNEY